MESTDGPNIRIYPKARHHAKETKRNNNDACGGGGVALGTGVSA